MYLKAVSVAAVVIWRFGTISATESREKQKFQFPFQPESIQDYAESGKGTIRGRVFYKFKDGETKSAMSSTVELWPDTDYTRERFIRENLKHEEFEPLDPRLKRLIHTVTTGNLGSFEFQHVAPGKYLVWCRITWDAPYTNTPFSETKALTIGGKLLARSLVIKSDEVVSFDLNQSAAVKFPSNQEDLRSEILYPTNSPTFDPLASEQAPKLVPKNATERKGTNKSHKPRMIETWDMPINSGAQGEYVVETWVGSDGVPTRSTVIWGPKEGRIFVEDCFLGALYKPIIENSKPIPFRFRSIMRFYQNDGIAFKPLPDDWLKAVNGSTR